MLSKTFKVSFVFHKDSDCYEREREKRAPVGRVSQWLRDGAHTCLTGGRGLTCGDARSDGVSLVSSSGVESGSGVSVGVRWARGVLSGSVNRYDTVYNSSGRRDRVKSHT